MYPCNNNLKRGHEWQGHSCKGLERGKEGECYIYILISKNTKKKEWLLGFSVSVKNMVAHVTCFHDMMVTGIIQQVDIITKLWQARLVIKEVCEGQPKVYWAGVWLTPS